MEPLSAKQGIELSEVWKCLGSGSIFVVHDGREFLVEGPEDRQDRQDRQEDTDDDQGVLRIWTDSEDAWEYAEEQGENYERRLRVMQVDLKRLYDLKRVILNNGFADYGVSVRADVCTLRYGEPVVVDTLWSSTLQPN